MNNKRYKMEMIAGVVIAGCIASSFTAMLLASKQTAQIVFYTAWLVCTHTLSLVVLFSGALTTRRGHVIASRAHTPFRFWTLLGTSYALFSWIGIHGILSVLGGRE